MGDIIFKEESYKIIGACMEMHNQLGKGFKEVVYIDALELEFKNKNLSYTREKNFVSNIKGLY